MSIKLTLFLSLAILITIFTMSSAESPTSYEQTIRDWQQSRYKNLKAVDGWLSVVGLFWLSEGMNGIGSASDNRVILPKDKSVAHLGIFLLRDGKVTANFQPGSKVFHGKKEVIRIAVLTDSVDKPTVFSHGTLFWKVLEREGNFGVRIHDTTAAATKNIDKLSYFPTQESWRVEATFEVYKEGKELQIPTVMEWYMKAKSPGKLSFERDGKRYQLDAIDSGDEYFIIFGDQTNNKQTYGAGRFIYVKKAEEGQPVIIDFNQSYNPPCAFTHFATCPIAPPQNKLDIAIEAGEKNFHF